MFLALCLCDVMRTCCLAVSNATRSRWCGHLCCTLRRQSPPAELLHPACAVMCACDEAWIRHVRAAHHILCAPCRSHRSGACPLRRSAPSCSKSSTRPRTYSCSRSEHSKPTICLIPFRASPGSARQTPAPLVLGPQVEHYQIHYHQGRGLLTQHCAQISRPVEPSCTWPRESRCPRPGAIMPQAYGKCSGARLAAGAVG